MYYHRTPLYGIRYYKKYTKKNYTQNQNIIYNMRKRFLSPG